MNVLAIGNSFSQDATRYLHDIAKGEGVSLTVVNLYIGGCSLRKHYLNALDDAKAYALEFNGKDTGFFVSIKEALVSRDWDVVTVQQASSLSTDFETFVPYIDFIKDYIKKYSPKSKIYIHQTWSYEEGSDKLCKLMGYKKQADMHKDIKAAYALAAKRIEADGVIPSGELMFNLCKAGHKMHRDTFHASYGLGRYALGLLWFKKLTGKSVANNSFRKFDDFVTKDEIAAACEAVEKL
ncbi:MAG: DUF4886 domain-containing protein [Ruminococcaceae bacterium]|nr:DUF4886 domain-containing protein [Oscillospiraceae bacterium]